MVLVDRQSSSEKRELPKAAIVAGGVALLALAAATFPEAIKDVSTIVGNIGHGHSFLSSFGTYGVHTDHVTQDAHFRVSEIWEPTQWGNQPPLPNNSDQDWQFTVPNGSGFLVTTISHFPAVTKTVSETIFTPFSLGQNVQMGTDLGLGTTAVAASVGYGARKEIDLIHYLHQRRHRNS